ncbi:uncharacterized protein LOC119588451 [Penaeus monodon]|uniref:uncharacterized protein LOC119588451 n=1 Tax=Penaeus monodon TaxID=6687 RepID=UPI0018A7B0AB|nr:uncharacterized protein LOC119588451 [Penaeus monodon]
MFYLCDHLRNDPNTGLSCIFFTDYPELKTESGVGISIAFLCNEDTRDRGIVYGFLAVLVTSIILISLMSYGAMKRRPAFLSSWVVWESLFIVSLGALPSLASLQSDFWLGLRSDSAVSVSSTKTVAW